jgi:iron(III) transport system permease protein
MARTHHSPWWLWAGWLIFFGVIFLPSVWFFTLTVAEETGRVAAGQGVAAGPSARTTRLLVRSLALGGGAAAVALALGTATGYLTTRVSFPGRRLFFVALLLPFFLPGYVYATTWVELLAPRAVVSGIGPSPSPVYSLGSSIIVLGLYLFPWVHLIAGAGFASIESHLEDAARLVLGGGRRFVAVTLPLVAGALAVAGLFDFVVGFKSHTIPMLMRQRVFASETLIAYERLGDDRAAAMKGLVIVIVALVALAVALWIALRRKRIAVEGISAPWRSSQAAGLFNGRKPRFGALAMAVALVVFSMTVVAPLAVLVHAAGAWSNYVVVWESAWPQVIHGLTSATAVATVTMILGFVLALQIGGPGRLLGSRLSSFGAGLALAALFVLFALPAPVLDLGLIRFWNRPGPMGWVYDSSAMLVLGQTAAFLPIAVLGLSVGLRRIDPGLIEAAEMAGLPWWTITRRILWPMLRTWLLGVWAIVFVLSLNDAEAAVLLAPAGQATLSVRIMTLLHYAPDAQVSALCVIQVVVTAIAVGLVAVVALAWRQAGYWIANRLRAGSV